MFLWLRADHLGRLRESGVRDQAGHDNVAVPYAATSLIMFAISLQSKRIAITALAPRSAAASRRRVDRLVAAVGQQLACSP